MYPYLIILATAGRRSVFGAAILVAGSENNPAAHDTSQQHSRALSTAQFALAQESTDQTSSQSQSISTGANHQQSSKNSVLPIAFSPDAEKAV